MKTLSTALLTGRRLRLLLALLVLGGGAAYFLAAPETPAGAPAPSNAAARPALTVTLVSPQRADWPQTLAANGSVVAWQEAVIGAELASLRIAEVRAEVGDRVRKGQLLARLDSRAAAAELAEARAAITELEAALVEARANAGQARELQAQGFYSRQANTRYQTAEQSAQARLLAAQARAQAAALRLAQTDIVAPDDGIVSARQASVGTLLQPGQELFRLIRGGRLEWRAEVPSADLGRLQPGLVARLLGPAGEAVEGRVRQVAPSVDPQTRNGLVFVDLPTSTVLKAGMFARGEFVFGNAPALILPQSAVVLREGFAYLFLLAEGERVRQVKVDTGRRQGEMIEIVAGVSPEARIVASGAGFLADGDAVRVVADAAR